MFRFAMAAVLPFLGLASPQAFAMAEYGAPFVDFSAHPEAFCADVNTSYIVEGPVVANVPLTVDIRVMLTLEDGSQKEILGRPVFVFAQTQSGLERGARVRPSKVGAYVVPRNGYFRVLADEVSEPLPSGVTDLKVKLIRICRGAR